VRLRRGSANRANEASKAGLKYPHQRLGPNKIVLSTQNTAGWSMFAAKKLFGL